MLKKLTKREVKDFIERYEIKCDSITLEKIQDDYYIIIDEEIRFNVNYDIAKNYL